MTDHPRVSLVNFVNSKLLYTSTAHILYFLDHFTQTFNIWSKTLQIFIFNPPVEVPRILTLKFESSGLTVHVVTAFLLLPHPPSPLSLQPCNAKATLPFFPSKKLTGDRHGSDRQALTWNAVRSSASSALLGNYWSDNSGGPTGAHDPSI